MRSIKCNLPALMQREKPIQALAAAKARRLSCERYYPGKLAPTGAARTNDDFPTNHKCGFVHDPAHAEKRGEILFDAVDLGGTRPLDAFSRAHIKPTRPEAGFHLSEATV